MKYIKRILSITICLLIMLTSAFYSYTRIDGRCLVYADSTTDDWQNVTTNAQLVEAFKYYCKSRDLTIEGSIADGVTSFTTQTFNGLCNTLGIDVTALQAQLKYQTDGNLGNRFLFSTLGIDAYNRIFAQFLQDNDLSIGDSADQANNTLYSGVTFLDYYNNLYLATVTDSNNSSSAGSSNAYSISPSSIWLGNPIDNYSPAVFSSILNNSSIPNGDYNGLPSYIVYTVENNSSTRTFSSAALAPYKSTIENKVKNSIILADSTGNAYGFYGIVYKPSNGHFYLCIISYDKTINKYATSWLYNSYIYPKNNGSQSCVIYLTTNNTVINNNNYEGDTIINNYGTPSQPNAPDPDDPTYTPPDYPSEPTDDPSNWGVELPDLDIPWFLRGKEDKFPWDIPYSMIVLLSVLNAEPEAPHIEGTLDLGVYEWNYELDLEQFDDVAAICRNMMFVAFLFGLMLLTKRLIWG